MSYRYRRRIYNDLELTKIIKYINSTTFQNDYMYAGNYDWYSEFSDRYYDDWGEGYILDALNDNQVDKLKEIVSIVSPQTTSYSLALPTRQTPVQTDMPVLEGIKFSGNKTPVESAIETRPFILQSTTNQQSDTVKKNVQNNELAGGVTIESIAKQPTNYAQYFSMIPDAAFYEPKEVYKNQKTVDNVRALRLLSSDRLHQQMVDQQYK